MTEQITSESRDGTGSGDHDAPYAFGNPRACLTLRVQARLTIMRGYVKDHVGASVGDVDWVEPTPSGLLVPIANWPDEA
jgi:hypothetical protein